MSITDIAKQHKEKCDKHRLTRMERMVVADWNMWTSVEGFAPADALQFSAPGHVLGPEYAMDLVRADKRSQRYSTTSILLDYNKLSVFAGCVNVRDSLKGAEFKKDSKTQIRDGVHAEDIAPRFKDALDAFGYGVNYCCPPETPIQTVSWDREKQAPPYESGAYGQEMAKRAWLEKLRKEQEEPDALFSEAIQFADGAW